MMRHYWSMLQYFILAAWNVMAPSYDVCISTRGTAGACPTHPSPGETLWWHTVTIVLLIAGFTAWQRWLRSQTSPSGGLD